MGAFTVRSNAALLKGGGNNKTDFFAFQFEFIVRGSTRIKPDMVHRVRLIAAHKTYFVDLSLNVCVVQGGVFLSISRRLEQFLSN